MQQIIETIRNMRELQKISQKEMAEMIGISQSSYNRFEKDNKK